MRPLHSRHAIDPVTAIPWASSRQVARRLIGDAVKGKYANLDAKGVSRLIEPIWDLATATESEDRLIALLARVKDARTDINNQVVTLQLVLRFWCRRPSMGILKKLHLAIYGLEQTRLRTDSYVADFGGIAPTDVAEIGPRLDELELTIDGLLPALRGGTVRAQSAFLAITLSSVIRIHPFPDGNGRVARMFVQFALAAWGLSLMPIPKVRNNARWKLALDAAVHGDVSALSRFLAARMAKNGARRGDTGQPE